MMQGYKLEFARSEKKDTSCKIINHFFVENMGVARIRNPCVSNFTLQINKKKNKITYATKPSVVDSDSTLSDYVGLYQEKTPKHLENLVELKNKYRNPKTPTQVIPSKEDSKAVEQAVFIMDRF